MHTTERMRIQAGTTKTPNVSTTSMRNSTANAIA
jgi:hypothetical protein